MAVNLHLTCYRFGYADGTESTHTWRAAEKGNPTVIVNHPFLLRLGIQQTEATAAANLAQQFRYNKNGAGWNNITTSSSVVKAVTPVTFADAATTTARLTNLTGSPDTSNANCTVDGSSGGSANDVPISGNSETVCGLQIISTDVANGDTIQFDCTVSGPTTTITKDITPQLTVSKPTFVLRETASADCPSTSTTSLACNKPTGTVEGDIMIALVLTRSGAVTDVPDAGWKLIASKTSANDKYYLYYKIATASEAATYTWTCASGRIGITICSYVGGAFDLFDPIDVVSNTNYVTSDANLQAAAMTITSANSPLIFAGGDYYTTAVNTHLLPTDNPNPNSWTEDADKGNATSDIHRTIDSFIWSGSGSTGIVNATISATLTTKHAFMVALNPVVYNRVLSIISNE